LTKSRLSESRKEAAKGQEEKKKGVPEDMPQLRMTKTGE